MNRRLMRLCLGIISGRIDIGDLDGDQLNLLGWNSWRMSTRDEECKRMILESAESVLFERFCELTDLIERRNHDSQEIK
jgi:hypothetical protein